MLKQEQQTPGPRKNEVKVHENQLFLLILVPAAGRLSGVPVGTFWPAGTLPAACRQANK